MERPEFYHRVLGRVVGLAFLIPFLIFLIQGKLKERKLIRDLMIIFFLGVLQGLAGWYMVKSGLIDDPNVSHYRLAVHLSLALTLFSFILWTGLRIRYPGVHGTVETQAMIPSFRILLAFTVIQIIYGAFVAGLKAGLYYPTWPLMGSHLLPPEAGVSVAEEGISSFFETASLVQFMHRWIAVFVAGIVFWIYFKNRNKPLGPLPKKILASMVIIVGLQFTLGVLTLLYHVPLSLALFHQLGGVAFLTSIIFGLFFFRYSNPGA